MQIPAELRHAVEQELAGCHAAALRVATARLTEGYRAGAPPAALDSAEALGAYVATRLPATYAAVLQSLHWTQQRCQAQPRTVLDLGSGPGSALWAAAECFPAAEEFTAVERDPRMRAAAVRMASAATHPALRAARWLAGDIAGALPAGESELVLCSYALNELAPRTRTELVAQAWHRCRGVLLLVEPGTMAGFANLMAARSQLLAAGATLLAPCPHAEACPMQAGGDWCHFAARVERTAEHRRLKGAELGWEDEKFAYLAVARAELAPPTSANGGQIWGPDPVPSRIVRHPRIFSGYAELTLCTAEGLRPQKVTRSQKDAWRRLKRAGWGDEW
jgi:ribosomal protein RSM22 (predicted rRNA methylase)